MKKNQPTNKQEKSPNARNIAWELFKQSGNPNYYRLYADLKDESQD